MNKNDVFNNTSIKPNKAKFKLKKIRNQIDRIDNKIIDLLEKRLSLALKTSAFKTNPKDKKREREIITRLINRRKKRNYIRPLLIKQIYSLIFRESLKLQKIKKKKQS